MLIDGAASAQGTRVPRVTIEEMPSGSAARRLIIAMTVVVCTAAVAIPYWVDRVLRRWWAANRLLAPVGTRMRRMQTRYRARRGSLAVGAEIIAAIAEVVDASMPPSRTPSGSSGRPDRTR